MKHYCGPCPSSSQLQGLFMPCLSFPPCPHLLKIVTHPGDGKLGEGFLPLLRKAAGLGVLVPSQAIPHSQALHQTSPHRCWGRCGWDGGRSSPAAGGGRCCPRALIPRGGTSPAQPTDAAWGWAELWDPCCEHQELPGKGKRGVILAFHRGGWCGEGLRGCLWGEFSQR